jgi:hypothetical protein
MIPSEVVAKPRLPCDRHSHGPRLQPRPNISNLNLKRPDLQDSPDLPVPVSLGSWWPLARGPPLRMRGGAHWRSATGTAPGRCPGGPGPGVRRVGMIAPASRQPPGPGPRAPSPACPLRGHAAWDWTCGGREQAPGPPPARSGWQPLYCHGWVQLAPSGLWELNTHQTVLERGTAAHSGRVTDRPTPSGSGQCSESKPPSR